MKWIKKTHLQCISLCFGVCLSFYWSFWLYCVTTVTRFIEQSEGLACVAGAKRGGGGRNCTKEGKGKGAPAIRAGVFVIRPPISSAVVLEFRELLKWITKWYWNLSELYECKHICHRDRFIFCITLWVFHNDSKSKLLTLLKKNSFVQLFYKLSSSYSHRNYKRQHFPSQWELLVYLLIVKNYVHFFDRVTTSATADSFTCSLRASKIFWDL